MIVIGKYNQLEVVKEVEFGVYLSDLSRSEEILLPLKYVPAGTKVEDLITVFVYHDSDNRPIATTLKPHAVVGDFAYLKVLETTAFGAFLDWGIAKDLFVPLREQSVEMRVGSSYIVYVYRDQETGRVAASSKWSKYVDNSNFDLQEEDEVQILVAESTDLGFNAIIENEFVGLIYKNEIYQPLQTGDRKRAWIKKIREENKIDLILQAIGYEHIEDAKHRILHVLKESNGYIPLGDKSEPEEIYKQLKLSKKSFKKTIGGLYKDRLIEISDHSIRLLQKS